MPQSATLKLRALFEKVPDTISHWPWAVLTCSATTALLFTVLLAGFLAARPEEFVLDASEEGFKVADAPESTSWDLMQLLWSGDYSDPIVAATAAASSPAASPGAGPGAGAGGGAHRGTAPGGQGRWGNMTEEEREAFRENFGGAGSGRGGGRGGSSQLGQNRAVAAGGALTARSIDAWRPHFVDVYMIKDQAADPTYFGFDYTGYGCCGAFAKEQRTWPESLDMLTWGNLKRLRDFENALVVDPEYKRYCYQELEIDDSGMKVGHVDASTSENLELVKCARPFSITNFFWPSVVEGPQEEVDCWELYEAGSYCQLLDDHYEVVQWGSNGSVPSEAVSVRIHTPDGNGTAMLPVDEVKAYLGWLWDRGLLDENYRLLLDRRFSGNRSNSRGLISKAVFEKPWRRSTTAGAEEEWEESFDVYLNNRILPLLATHATDDIEYLAYTPSFLQTWRSQGISNAISWSSGALCMVFLLLWIRLRDAVREATGRHPLVRAMMSLVLPLAAMLHVLISFPVSWAIYRFIYQQRYIGYMQFLSIFLALGIGVDDVFLMYDAWVQSREEGFKIDELHSRLRFAWCRAARAMLVTTVTDGLAFLANAVSIIAAVRCFGYMMFTIVVVNYILDVTLFPACLVLVTRWTLANQLPQTTRVQASDTNPSAAVIGVMQEEEETEETASRLGISKELRARGSRMEAFLQDKLGNAVYKCRMPVLAAGLVLVVSFAAGLSQVQFSDRAFRFETFPDWFPMNKIFNMGMPEEPGDIFGDPTPVQPVYVLWGAVGVDRSDAASNNPLDKGTPVLSTDFDLANPSTQVAVLDLCSRLQALASTRRGEVICPLRHFREWVLETSNATGAPAEWPVTNRTRFMEDLVFFANSPIRKAMCQGNRLGFGSYDLRGDGGFACRAFFETGAMDRAGLAYRALRHQEYAQFFGANSAADRVLWAIGAVVNSTLSSQSSAVEGRAVYREIQAALDAVSDEAGERAMQAAALWPQMVTEEAMVQAAWQGSLISLCVGGLTLLAFTWSPTLSFMATLGIASIVVVTMGLLPIIGWKFGFMEAMCMVFVVGFSVDFVAHCAVSFLESQSQSRAVKAVEALGTVGASLFWGALTTVCAAFFLIFCAMVPFSKMGVFLIWNQVVSFTTATVLFAAALMVVGPVTGTAKTSLDPS